MAFDYRVYTIQGENMLAISDSSIIGKTLSEGDMLFQVSREFYGGDTCDEKKALLLIKNATIINAVGKSIVSLLIRKKLVDEGKIIYIEGVPHAQIVVIK